MTSSTASPKIPWHIRFGQIFRHRLAALEKSDPESSRCRFQDCFYFHPQEEDLFLGPTPFSAEQNPFEKFDLNQNVENYRKFFTPKKSSEPWPMEGHLKLKFTTTFIVVPTPDHPFLPLEEPLKEALSALNAQGFDFRYASGGKFPDNYRQAAKNVLETISQWSDLKDQCIFLGYGHGIRVLIELICDKNFRPFEPKLRGLISLGGAIQKQTAGRKSKESFDPVPFLKIFHRFQQQSSRENPPALPAPLVKTLKETLDLDIPWSSGVRKVVEFLESQSQDLIAFPEDWESTLSETPRWDFPEEFAENLPQHCNLFTLAAVFPRKFFVEPNRSLPTSADDLYLYLTSKHLGEKLSPWNDGQVVTRTMFFPQTLRDKAIHLGILRADHWGLAYTHVLSRVCEDRFPRLALMEALVLFLAEYYGSGAQD